MKYRSSQSSIIRCNRGGFPSSESTRNRCLPVRLNIKWITWHANFSTAVRPNRNGTYTGNTTIEIKKNVIMKIWYCTHTHTFCKTIHTTQVWYCYELVKIKMKRQIVIIRDLSVSSGTEMRRSNGDKIHRFKAAYGTTTVFNIRNLPLRIS